MARQLRIEYAGALYHVTARGNERKEIYSDDKDKEKFLEYVQRCHERFGIKIHAYCLMNNHYHLLLETPQANLSRSMQHLNTGYTIYYNLRHKRTGHLLQGRYKAILVEKDAYLIELSRYIHLNPVRTGIVQRPEEYFWSSYKYFSAGKGQIPEFFEEETTINYFKHRKEYLKFVREGIGPELKNPNSQAVSGCVLGSEEFVEEIKEKYLEVGKRTEDLPGLKELRKKKIDQAKILEIISAEKKITEKEKDKLKIYFLRKFTGKTLREIAEECFRGQREQSISGISKIVKRMEERKRRDAKLAAILEQLEEQMSKVKV